MYYIRDHKKVGPHSWCIWPSTIDHPLWIQRSTYISGGHVAWGIPTRKVVSSSFSLLCVACQVELEAILWIPVLAYAPSEIPLVVQEYMYCVRFWRPKFIRNSPNSSEGLNDADSDGSGDMASFSMYFGPHCWINVSQECWWARRDRGRYNDRKARKPKGKLA